MDRFCDYIKIYRKNGDVYNPFADSTSPPPDNDPNGIYGELIWEGNCKGEMTSGVSVASVADRNAIRICINENNILADIGDFAMYTTNNEGQAICLSIIDVKRYEHNTILLTNHLKDGDNEEV